MYYETIQKQMAEQRKKRERDMAKRMAAERQIIKLVSAFSY